MDENLPCVVHSCHLALEEADEEETVELMFPEVAQELDPDDVNLLYASETWRAGGEVVQFPPDSPFVYYTRANGAKVPIKKTTLCWLLHSGGDRLSSDRLVRVKQTTESQQHGQGGAMFDAARRANVTVGEWCVFRKTERVAVGRVLGFAYLSGRSLKYSLPSAPISVPNGTEARGLVCRCSWFEVGAAGSLEYEPSTSSIEIEQYMCTIQPPTLSPSGALKLTNGAQAYIDAWSV